MTRHEEFGELTTYITYTSYDEMIVCTKEDEVDMLQEFFLLNDRDADEYDRVETTDFPYVSSRLVAEH